MKSRDKIPTFKFYCLYRYVRKFLKRMRFTMLSGGYSKKDGA